MPYLSDEGLKHLLEYRYESGLYGFIDRVIMTPFWNKAVTFLPLWLAPNLVTLLALLHAVFAAIVLHLYAPIGNEGPPRWVFFLTAYCNFMYQTLDAIDGKQARRTGSSSPLGQLFDHGCDAISAVLSSLNICRALMIGSGPYSILVFQVHLTAFFFSNWEETQTGFMRFGQFGVTESQDLLIIMMLVSGTFGPEVWHTQVFQGYAVADVVMVIVFFTNLKHLFECVMVVLKYFSVDAERKVAQKKSAIWQMIQFFILVILSTLWFMSPTGLYQRYYSEMTIAIGFTFAFLVSRLIICHVSNTPYEKLYSIMFPLPFVVMNSWSMLASQPFNEVLVLRLYLAYVLFVYFHFVISVIQEICAFLNIRVFSITPTSDAKRK